MTCPSCGASNDDQAAACFSCKAPLALLGEGDLLAGRWEIRAFLGRGGMGAVYRAHDRTLNEEVALKIIRPDLMGTPETRDRFTSEIKLARRVSHPGVCRIHEYGEDGPRRFFTMELVEGRNLRDVIREDGPLPPQRASALAAEMADALQAIHAAGIIHRDLKPLNVMVDREGRVRLMDFGIAKGLGPGAQGTASGYVVGSPEYMSPEQACGRPVDARSDVYALGIVLFEMLAGSAPFRAADPVATLLMQVEEAPTLGGFEEPLRAILERALAKDPGQRFQTAAGMAQALRRMLPVAGGTPTRPLRAVRSRSRWAVAGALAAVALAAAMWRMRPEPEPRPEDASPSPPPAPTAPASPAPAPVASRRAAAGPVPIVPATRPAVATVTPTAAPTVEPTAEPSPDLVPEIPTATPAPPEPTPAPTATLPATGRLFISVTPWANVSVDGVHVGETPLTLDLAPGEHKVVLTHRDYQPVHRVVRIVGGQVVRVPVDLARDGIRR